MNFRGITLGDKRIFGKFGYICSDYQFSYLYMYNELYKLKIAESNGAVIIRSDMDTDCYYMLMLATEHGRERMHNYCGKTGTLLDFFKILNSSSFCTAKAIHSFISGFKLSPVSIVKSIGQCKREQEGAIIIIPYPSLLAAI